MLIKSRSEGRLQSVHYCMLLTWVSRSGVNYKFMVTATAAAQVSHILHPADYEVLGGCREVSRVYLDCCKLLIVGSRHDIL